MDRRLTQGTRKLWITSAATDVLPLALPPDRPITNALLCSPSSLYHGGRPVKLAKGHHRRWTCCRRLSSFIDGKWPKHILNFSKRILSSYCQYQQRMLKSVHSASKKRNHPIAPRGTMGYCLVSTVKLRGRAHTIQHVTGPCIYCLPNLITLKE